MGWLWTEWEANMVIGLNARVNRDKHQAPGAFIRGCRYAWRSQEALEEVACGLERGGGGVVVVWEKRDLAPFPFTFTLPTYLTPRYGVRILGAIHTSPGRYLPYSYLLSSVDTAPDAPDLELPVAIQCSAVQCSASSQPPEPASRSEKSSSTGRGKGRRGPQSDVGRWEKAAAGRTNSGPDETSIRAQLSKNKVIQSVAGVWRRLRCCAPEHDT